MRQPHDSAMEDILILKRDWEFYCEGCFNFQVGVHLFRVPCYLFEATFEEVIPMKRGEPVVIQGRHEPPRWKAPVPEFFDVANLSNQHLILLDGINELEFRAFLRVLCSSWRKAWSSIYHDKDQWISVLKLSTMWKFAEERKIAIQALEKMLKDPVEKLTFSARYDIPSWRDPALVELSKRREPLTLMEGEMIGLESVINLAVMREAHARGLSDTGTLPGGVPV
ncbi:hypothetical protein BDN72DRAFT_833208 [Pluteus cervinus]|uniref:Uncharacterized protein n=1 Tax=Pluteus cervinus TaxID=181527 RepID=A0ACD3B9J3_9AGAR|nr:hypothetical protein BDN72DRAFT_833208 [Pluteus cervinus]